MPAQKRGETIADLEAKLAAMKQAEVTRHPHGRPKGSKNKAKEDRDMPPKPTKCSAKVKAMPVPSKNAPAVDALPLDGDSELAMPEPCCVTAESSVNQTEHELTDIFLTNVEGNGPRRVTFGFTKGDLDNTRNTTASTQAAHTQRVAQKVLVEHPSGRWATTNPATLMSSVLNESPVYYKAELGATGFGSTDSDAGWQIVLRALALNGFTVEVLVHGTTDRASGGPPAPQVNPGGPNQRGPRALHLGGPLPLRRSLDGAWFK
ncbi:hypothetical protein GGX14DRAFT_401451 [Mycena pura]|uniref:Uncharacterized protein n=1 Tax=Mycena pura TaxID=153505 RepID=A0AAD6V7A3_9AGAR|nr:hypothetical protein GGX14DRAFT_401451 [Mycena pura]